MDDIFKRELRGEVISPTKEPDFQLILDVIDHALELTTELNQLNYRDPRVKDILKELFGKELDQTTILIPPFYTDFGRNIIIGKGCMIQQCCTFFDRGGIIIGNNVAIAPKVNLITLNHDFSPTNRDATFCSPITIEDNVWIGINSTVLPGITIGKNAVVAANSVVTKNVTPNTIVGGNPAKYIKAIEE